jgi:RNA polymerase sigma factor (sigma-70 family)
MAASPRPTPAARPHLSAAAAAFYLQVYRPARAGCLNELRKAGCDEEEAEEIFAATLEHVMASVDPVERSFAVPQMVNFIKRAAWRTLIDERRRRGRRPEVELSAVEAVIDGGAEGPEEAAEEREAVAIGREALAMLPERDRLIFRQRHEMDLSPEEILERTPGLSLRTYRKIIQRANGRVLAAFEKIEGGGRCEEMESGLLSRYVADACGEDEHGAVEVHLAHCRHCQIAYARMRGRLFDVAGGLAGTLAAASAGAGAHTGRLGAAAARVLDIGQGILAGTRTVRERLRDQALRAASSMPGSGGDAAAGQLIGASGAKIAAGCIAGTAATAAACVALGVGPLAVVGISHHPPPPRPVERPVRHRHVHHVHHVLEPTPPEVQETTAPTPEAVSTPPPAPSKATPEKPAPRPSHHRKAAKKEAVQQSGGGGQELTEGLEGAGRTPSGGEAEEVPQSEEPAASSSSVSPDSADSSESGAASAGGTSGSGGSGHSSAPVDGGKELGL